MRKRIQNSLKLLIPRHRFDEPVHITRPSMPDLDAYRDRLAPVWASGWLTNRGQLHEEFKAALMAHLGVEHLSLCCNGTIALLLALQACGIDGGEVITTPFTFPATPHSLHWNRLRPVFCDIEPETFTLDPRRIEALIGPETRAILPVHVFGNPCDVEAIAAIAEKHGLVVIYDAAHMMGVRYRGRSILNWGDCSTLSFHATKLFSTAEGGAIVSRREADRVQIDYLNNFGIADEETVVGPGINGKLNELQCAFGLLQLTTLGKEIDARRILTERYRRCLASVPGILACQDQPEVEHNYAYFTILVEEERYGMSRNELHEALRACNVVTRKYFHPLCSHFPIYSSLPSADPENLKVAESVADRILCLPLYGSLAPESVERIATLIAGLQHDD